MQLSMGNIPFYWRRQDVFDFYMQVADSSVDQVYIGESVCSKRRELTLEDWLDVARHLSDNGKQVVLSTLALLEARSELSTLKKHCANGELLVEANDFAAVNVLSENNLPFVAGAALNIYNQHDIQILLQRGMQRWVAPVELSREWITDVLAACEDMNVRQQFEVEVYGYGYLPLAYSARCFTARSEQRLKDQCGLCCIDYPQGRAVDSQEGEALFRLNGIQTMSGKRQNLINDLPQMHGIIDLVRLSPDSEAVLDWSDKFRENLYGKAPQCIEGYCNGYWHKIEGMKQVAS